LRAEFPRHVCRIQGECIGDNIRKDDSPAGAENAVGGGNERVAWDDDLVAGLKAQGQHGQLQRVRAGRRQENMWRLQDFRQFLAGTPAALAIPDDFSAAQTIQQGLFIL
jgi:hypothetical protein